MNFDRQRVEQPNGVAINVVLAGDAAAPPVILLHGFPESHRTWREVAPKLAKTFRVIMPDLRGFGASDKPEPPLAYRIDHLIGDVLGVADALGLSDFNLVGHDWGGALAWSVAIGHPKRLRKLGIVNAPHPVIFQRTLINDTAQREASQYMNKLRAPGSAAGIRAQGFDWFFDRTFEPHVELAAIDPEERAHYIADWSQPGAMEAMLNWYRMTGIVAPLPGAKMEEPKWTAKVPSVRVPTLVIWGMKDKVLLPIQLDGLDPVVDDLTIKRLPDAGHFAPWEAGDDVAEALLAFL